jgi:hypothetical protein
LAGSILEVFNELSRRSRSSAGPVLAFAGNQGAGFFNAVCEG